MQENPSSVQNTFLTIHGDKYVHENCTGDTSDPSADISQADTIKLANAKQNDATASKRPQIYPEIPNLDASPHPEPLLRARLAQQPAQTNNTPHPETATPISTHDAPNQGVQRRTPALRPHKSFEAAESPYGERGPHATRRGHEIDGSAATEVGYREDGYFRQNYDVHENAAGNFAQHHQGYAVERPFMPQTTVPPMSKHRQYQPQHPHHGYRGEHQQQNHHTTGALANHATVVCIC